MIVLRAGCVSAHAAAHGRRQQQTGLGGQSGPDAVEVQQRALSFSRPRAVDVLQDVPERLSFDSFHHKDPPGRAIDPLGAAIYQAGRDSAFWVRVGEALKACELPPTPPEFGETVTGEGTRRGKNLRSTQDQLLGTGPAHPCRGRVPFDLHRRSAPLCCLKTLTATSLPSMRSVAE